LEHCDLGFLTGDLILAHPWVVVNIPEKIIGWRHVTRPIERHASGTAQS
jgi:hypothetical protein